MSKNKSVNSFVKVWINATWHGFIYSLLLGFLLLIFIIKVIAYPEEIKELLVLWAATIFGEIIGLCQWNVLRDYGISHSAWWIVVTNIGWIVAFIGVILLDLYGEIANGFYGYRGVLFGGLLAATQYLFVRRYSRYWQKSIMWIVVTTFTGFMIESIFQVLREVVKNSPYPITSLDYFLALLFLIWPLIAVTLAAALPGWMLGSILKDYFD